MVLQLGDYDAPHQNLICLLRCYNGKNVDKKENGREKPGRLGWKP
jgi:hypothetical protein